LAVLCPSPHPTPLTPPLFPYTTLFRSQVPADSSPRRHSQRREGLSRGQRADGVIVPLNRLSTGLHTAYTRSRPIRRSMRLAMGGDRKSTRLNSSHGSISYAVFCLKTKY